MEKPFRNLWPLLAALPTLIFFGFHKSYFGVAREHFMSISWPVHLHAAAGVSWALLLVAQAALAGSERLRAHRVLGKLSYLLFPILLLSAAPMLFYVWVRGDLAVMLSAIADAALLLVFFSAAIVYRRKTAIHQRFMLATGLVLLDPTIGRLAGNALGPAWGMHTTFILIDAILLAAVLFDWKRGQNFRPWLVALGCFLVYQIMAYRLAATWHPFEKSPNPLDLARIEQSEMQAWRDLFAAQPADWKMATGTESADVDGVAVWTNQKIPFTHFNVALNTGLERPLTEEALDGILAHFRKQKIRKFFIQTTPVTRPTEVPDWLVRRGLRHVETWHRIARGNEPLAAPLSTAPGHSVEEVTAATTEEWADFIDKTYEMEHPTKQWLLALLGRPGWHHLICRKEGKIVAVRSMRVNTDRTAYFCIEAPVPGFMTDDFEPDYLICRRLIEIGLAEGVEMFTADIEKPSLALDGEVYEFWYALGFEVAYEKRSFMF